MSNSPKLWEAYQLSETWNQRPSELYGITHPVQAFYFDRAVWVFGKTLKADLEKAAEKAKKPKQAEQAQMKVLNKWLGHSAVGFAQPQITRTK